MYTVKCEGVVSTLIPPPSHLSLMNRGKCNQGNEEVRVMKAPKKQGTSAPKITKARITVAGDKDNDSVKHALQLMGIELRYNVRSNKTEWRTKTTLKWLKRSVPDWVQFKERYMKGVWLDIRKNYSYISSASGNTLPMSIAKEMCFDMFEVIASKNEVDPFVLLLNEIKRRTPVSPTIDEIDNYETDLDRMFELVFGQSCDRYERHIARMIVLGAVQRTFEPGCKLDEVPILRGRQGLGKDLLINSLFEDPAEYCTESFSFNLNIKERLHITNGKVIVCAAEMAGMTYVKDIEEMKNWITTSVDDGRLSYGKFAESYPRRFTLVGTTNASSPIPADPTGSRRWMVMSIDKPKDKLTVKQTVVKYRDVFWALAMEMYELGYRANRPHEMAVEQHRRNAIFENSDSEVDDMLKAAIDREIIPQKATISQIGRACGMLKDGEVYLKRDAKHRMIAALVRAEFEKCHNIQNNPAWTRHDLPEERTHEEFMDGLHKAYETDAFDDYPPEDNRSVEDML